MTGVQTCALPIYVVTPNKTESTRSTVFGDPSTANTSFAVESSGMPGASLAALPANTLLFIFSCREIEAASRMLDVEEALDGPDVEQQMVVVKRFRIGRNDSFTAWLEADLPDFVCSEQDLIGPFKSSGRVSGITFRNV